MVAINYYSRNMAHLVSCELQCLKNEKAEGKSALRQYFNTHSLYCVEKFLMFKNYVQSNYRLYIMNFAEHVNIVRKILISLIFTLYRISCILSTFMIYSTSYCQFA
jgi:hypothetical protein